MAALARLRPGAINLAPGPPSMSRTFARITERLDQLERETDSQLDIWRALRDAVETHLGGTARASRKAFEPTIWF